MMSSRLLSMLRLPPPSYFPPVAGVFRSSDWQVTVYLGSLPESGRPFLSTRGRHLPAQTVPASLPRLCRSPCKGPRGLAGAGRSGRQAFFARGDWRQGSSIAKGLHCVPSLERHLLLKTSSLFPIFTVIRKPWPPNAMGVVVHPESWPVRPGRRGFLSAYC